MLRIGTTHILRGWGVGRTVNTTADRTVGSIVDRIVLTIKTASWIAVCITN